MENKTDILNLDDVKTLVDSFYAQVRDNKLLAPIFNDVINDNWSTHLEKMYRFWQTVLLNQHSYQGSPFSPHAKLPIEAKHFDEWLTLFYKTIDTHFSGEKAKEAKWRGEKMASMFQSKINYYKEHPEIQVL